MHHVVNIGYNKIQGFKRPQMFSLQLVLHRNPFLQNLILLEYAERKS